MNHAPERLRSAPKVSGGMPKSLSLVPVIPGRKFLQPSPTYIYIVGHIFACTSETRLNPAPARLD